MGSNLGVSWSWQGHLPDPMKELPRVHPLFREDHSLFPSSDSLGAAAQCGSRE